MYQSTVPYLVGVTGFEPAASTSQTSRATNCATPRCVIFIRFLVIFRKWSNLWSDHFFVLVLEKRMCEKVSIYKGFRAFEKSRSQNRLHAPKRRALPTAPHPERKIECLIVFRKWSYLRSSLLKGLFCPFSHGLHYIKILRACQAKKQLWIDFFYLM